MAGDDEREEPKPQRTDLEPTGTVSAPATTVRRHGFFSGLGARSVARVQAEIAKHVADRTEHEDRALTAQVGVERSLGRLRNIDVEIDAAVAEQEALRNRHEADRAETERAKLQAEAQLEAWKNNERAGQREIDEIQARAEEAAARAEIRALTRQGLLSKARMNFAAIEDLEQEYKDAKTAELRAKIQIRLKGFLRENEEIDLRLQSAQMQEGFKQAHGLEPRENFLASLTLIVTEQGREWTPAERDFATVYNLLDTMVVPKLVNPPVTLDDWIDLVRSQQPGVSWLTEDMERAFIAVAQTLKSFHE